MKTTRKTVFLDLATAKEKGGERRADFLMSSELRSWQLESGQARRLRYWCLLDKESSRCVPTMAADLAARPMKISDEEMRDAQINVAFRDHCAHKLVDLNECRRENFFLPWTCQHEKHSYEKCQYKEYIFRCKAMVEQQQAAAAAAAAAAES